MSYKQWFRGIRLKLFILVMIPVALFTVLGWKSVSSLRSLSDSLKTQGLTRLPLSRAINLSKESLMNRSVRIVHQGLYFWRSKSLWV